MNILLVGLGGMAQCHYMNYQHIPEAHVTACVGRSDTDHAAAQAWGLPLFESITQACQNTDVDLVDVCAPTYLHRTLALEAIEAGKHVICEKPMALSRADAAAMYEAAERKGVQLYAAQVLQFTREVDALRTVVRNARYGKPLDACFERLTACPNWSRNSWLLDPEKSGLVPYDLHIHDLDVIVSIFGKPSTMSCTRCKGSGDAPSEQFRFAYGYANGMTICAEAAWFNAAIPFTARWRVYFERGMLICDHNGVIGYDANGKKTVFDVSEPFLVDCGINLGKSGWFLRELTHILACARLGRPSPLVPREQVLDVLEILDRL